MKAAVIEGPGVLTIRDLPEPTPGDYQARCDLLFGAVCSGTDQHLVAGHPPFSSWFKTPAILGHETIGRVTAVGAKVRYLKPGDLVTRAASTPVGGVNIAWGGFAEVGIATDWQAMQEAGRPAAEWQGSRVQQVLPAGTDPAAATMIITWRETLSFIRRIGLARDQRLLVLGSGGNGLAFAHHAQHLGATCTLLGSPSRAMEAAQVGATLIDYRANNLAHAINEVSGKEPFDVIIDAVGKARGVDPVLSKLREGGTLAVYGLDELTTFAINPMAATKSFRFYKGGYDEAEVHDEVVKLMQQGKLDPRPFLSNFTSPFALADLPAAIAAVRERRCVKALVRLKAEA